MSRKTEVAQLLALDEIETALEKARAAGVFCFVALRMEQPQQDSITRTHFVIRVKFPENTSNEMKDHTFADAVRDLAVEWSNQRHDSKLEWKGEGNGLNLSS